MKLSGILYVTVIGLLLIGYIESQRPPASFISVCNPYISDEIYYTGRCSLRFPWTLLGEVQEHINNADSTWTIYRFIKEYFLIGIDDFYRETYYNVDDPIDLIASLDALIMEGLEFLDRFLEPGCLTNIQVVEFTQPFYDSGFNQSRWLVFEKFYEKFPEMYSCGTGNDIGLCPRTRDILNLTYITDFYDRSVDNLVRSFSQAIFDKYSNSSHIPGKNALENLLSKVDALGIDGASVAELNAFTNSVFYEGIRDYYLNETVSTTTRYVRPTTTKSTNEPTITTSTETEPIITTVLETTSSSIWTSQETDTEASISTSTTTTTTTTTSTSTITSTIALEVTSTSKPKSSGLSAGEIVGISIASVVVFSGLAFGIGFIVYKKVYLKKVSPTTNNVEDVEMS